MLKAKVQFIAVLLIAGLFAWACGPAAAAVRIEGQVQGGGGPIAKSTVTLWAASARAPTQLSQELKRTLTVDLRFPSNSRRATTPACILSPRVAKLLSTNKLATTLPSRS